MINSSEMKNKKNELVRKASCIIVRDCYKMIERRVAESFYEFAESGRISIEEVELDKIAKKVMESLEVFEENTPILFDEINERAYSKLEELLKQSGWLIECKEKGQFLLPMD